MNMIKCKVNYPSRLSQIPLCLCVCVWLCVGVGGGGHSCVCVHERESEHDKTKGKHSQEYCAMDDGSNQLLKIPLSLWCTDT